MQLYGIEIDYSRDERLSEFGLSLLKQFYMQPYETSPQESFARAASAYCAGDLELAQRIYDYASKGWFGFSTPILFNAPRPGEPWKGMPISCFVTYTGDSLEELINHSTEIRWLSVKGGGVGGYWGDVRSVSKKSPGPIPFLKTIDADMTAYSQGHSRRGSYAAYLDISHPEIQEFIQIRVPTGGDPNRKCPNLHHAVNIPDKFMEALAIDGNWDLIDPDDQTVRDTIPARQLWQQILEARARTGEPYLTFIDTANRALPEALKKLGLKIHSSQLCVAPETKILTTNGQQTISDLKDQQVTVWNGREWSDVTVRQTGTNQHVITIELSSGETVAVTPEHKFYVWTRKNKTVTEVRAKDLLVGQQLQKLDSLPVIEGTIELPDAYTNGFYTADGCETHQGKRLYLYGNKRLLREHINVTSQWQPSEEQDREIAYNNTLREKFFVPNSKYTIDSRLDWLAGYLDGDGCVATNERCQSLQVASVRLDFLREVQLMLQTLGVQAKITDQREDGWYKMPDGHGGLAMYHGSKAWRLLITSNDLYQLSQLGLKCHRLRWSVRKPLRNTRQFSKVKSIIDSGRYCDTYCFTEPKRHLGVFNGILAGNCNEIYLATNSLRTAVCCLLSACCEFYDEWSKTTMIQDLIRFLDNVLQTFIDNAPPELAKAVFSATQERSLGLGLMGFHSYLQAMGIPFDSVSAKFVNLDVFKHIKEQAVIASRQLAQERGEYPDGIGTRLRNSHLLAIAPNANSAIIANTSPSVEPIKSNAFTQRTRAGSFLVKNRHLEQVLSTKGLNNEELNETWSSIIEHKGSVQHLDCLDEDEKWIFRTAFEINQEWIVDHAGDRQKFICQGQSINLFFPAGTPRALLNRVHIKAWKAGLKGLYYLRTEAGVNTETISKQVQRVALSDFITSSDNSCMSCAA